MPSITSHRTRQYLLETGAAIENPEDLPERVQLYDAEGNPLNIPLGARRVETLTTGVLTAAVDTGKVATRLAGGGVSGSWDLGVGVLLTKIVVNRPARVRLYTTPAKRDADIARTRFIDPVDRDGLGATPDHGCLSEFLLISTLSLENIPADYLYSGDATPTIYYRIDNYDIAAGTVTVTLTVKDVEQ